MLLWSMLQRPASQRSTQMRGHWVMFIVPFCKAYDFFVQNDIPVPPDCQKQHEAVLFVVLAPSD